MIVFCCCSVDSGDHDLVACVTDSFVQARYDSSCGDHDLVACVTDCSSKLATIQAVGPKNSTISLVDLPTALMKEGIHFSK